MPFSSAPATRPSADTELLSVIDSEIKYAEDCDDHGRVNEPIPLSIIKVKNQCLFVAPGSFAILE
jgi:hypothetical protein